MFPPIPRISITHLFRRTLALLGTLFIVSTGVLVPGCWLNHDYTNCSADDDCSSVQVCDDQLCRLQDGVQICGDGYDECSGGFECDESLAACVPAASDGETGADAGSDSSTDTDIVEDLPVDTTDEVGGRDLNTADGDLTTNDDVVEDSGTDPDVAIDTQNDVPITLVAPTNVAATDAEHASFVLVTWSPVEGATSYRVYRDDSLIGTTSEFSFADDSAEPMPPTSVGISLRVDAQTDLSVRVRWADPFLPGGVLHQYHLIAVNTAGQSQNSATDAGSVAPQPIQSFELERGGVWTDVGNVNFYDDFDATAGQISSVGIATASVTDDEDAFGRSVDISDGRIVVGAPLLGVQGTAVVFELDDEGSWEETETLGLSPDLNLGLLGAEVVVEGYRTLVSDSVSRVFLFEDEGTGFEFDLELVVEGVDDLLLTASAIGSDFIALENWLGEPEILIFSRPDSATWSLVDRLTNTSVVGFGGSSHVSGHRLIATYSGTLGDRNTAFLYRWSDADSALSLDTEFGPGGDTRNFGVGAISDSWVMAGNTDDRFFYFIGNRD